MSYQGFIPVALASIMFSMGLGLKPTDFKQLFTHPKAPITTLLVQLFILPTSALLISQILALSPALSLGLVLIAACPGGISSNMLTRLANGDTALSVGLTAVTSFISVLSIPVVILIASHYINGSATFIALSFSQMFIQIIALTAIPLSAGMLLRSKYPSAAIRLEPTTVMITSFIFIALVALTWADQWQNIKSAADVAGLAVILVLTINIAIGVALGKIMQLRKAETTTMLIEVGIQNSAMAFMIAANILQDMTVAIPSALYSVLMVLAGLTIVVIRRTRPK